jgi:hypothetical protein
MTTRPAYTLALAFAVLLGGVVHSAETDYSWVDRISNATYWQLPTVEESRQLQIQALMWRIEVLEKRLTELEQRCSAIAKRNEGQQ